MLSIRVQALALAGCLIACARADWTPTGPYGGEAEVVRTVPRQPELVVAATRNGLFYQSADGGASWVNRHFPAQLSGTLHALEVDPRYPGVWYAGMETGDGRAGVYKTKDGGATWTQLAGLQGRNVWSIAIFPGGPDTVAAGTSEGVYLSKDAGESWVAISPANDPELRPIVSLAFHPTASNTIYAGTTHLPWRTRDGGAHWQSIHSGMLDDSDVFSIAVEAHTPSNVFASACSGVYRSGDGGSSWRRLATPRGAFRTYLVTVDPQHPGVVFAATSAGLLRSANGGAVWQRVSPHAVKSIAFDAANPGRVFFASVTGGLLVSRDGGNTLAESNAGFSNRNFSAVAGSRGVLYASTVYEPASGGIFRTEDQGRTWVRRSSPASENILLLAAAPDDPDRLYAAGYRNLYCSTDGARTWLKQQTPTGAPRITALLPLAGKSLLLGTASGLFRQAGASWTPVGSLSSNRPVELLHRSVGGATVAVMPGGAFRSDNGGSSWTACGAPVPGAVWYGLALDAGPGGGALAATAQGMFRSTDRCATWSPVRGGLDPATVSAVVFHPQHAGEALAAQFGKIYRTVDGGLSWRLLGDAGRNGAYPSALIVLPDAPQRLFALFPRRGILSTSIDLNRSNTSTGGN